MKLTLNVGQKIKWRNKIWTIVADDPSKPIIGERWNFILVDERNTQRRVRSEQLCVEVKKEDGTKELVPDFEILQ